MVYEQGDRHDCVVAAVGRNGDPLVVAQLWRPSRIGNVVGQARPASETAILGYETAISFQRLGCVSNAAAGRDASGDCR